jgi:hypothetical protein
LALHPQILHGVLQRGAHASILGQGCAHLQGHSARRAHRSATCPWLDCTISTCGFDLR